jgi:hypothetical protein
MVLLAVVLAVGVAVALLPNDAGQITARLLIVAAVAAGALADRIDPAAGEERSGWSGTPVEIASLASMICYGAVAYLVFFASAHMAHRNAFLFAATGGAALTLIIAEILQRHGHARAAQQ